jgi:hypothetical protein
MTVIHGTAFQHPSDDGARHIANAYERDFTHEKNLDSENNYTPYTIS